MSRFSRPEPLTRAHDRSAFDCGEPALTEWLARFALPNQTAGVSRTSDPLHLMLLLKDIRRALEP